MQVGAVLDECEEFAARLDGALERAVVADFCTAKVWVISLPVGSLSRACHEPCGRLCGRMNCTPGAPLRLEERTSWWNSRLASVCVLASSRSCQTMAAAKAFLEPPRRKS